MPRELKPSAVEVLNLPAATLGEAPGNPNSMTEPEFGLLKEAIRRAGFLQPILVRWEPNPAATDGGGRHVVVDGHHRLRAVKELAAERGGIAMVSCVVVEGPDAEWATAQRVAMNRLRGSLDLTAVGQSLQGLLEAGWEVGDLTVTGFSEGEVADLLRSVTHTAADMLPDDMVMPSPEPEDDAGGTTPFVLELAFANRDELKAARRGLKRMAGKGGDLATGLLKLLGEEKRKSTGQEEEKS
jgi:ParB-like chromosome segregation protein Spo0J